MPVESSGTLLYRQGEAGLEVLLVHPSGWYNRKAPWGIPKGLVEPAESHEEAARRETWEETGVQAQELVSLGFVIYRKSKKHVYCFAGPLPPQANPHCASWEIDGAELLPLPEAHQRIHPDQGVFLDRLVETLAHRPGRSP